MKIPKIIKKIIACLVLGNFVYYGVPVYAQDAAPAAEENSGSLSAEVKTLRVKVNQLEKTVAGQSELIAQQKKILEKIAEVVPEVKAMLAPPEPKTLVKRFVVNGSMLFTAEELEKVLDKYKDKELAMSDLKKAADDITALYRKKGYLVSLAYLPPQEISNNTVEFTVVEGRVGEITVEKPKYSKAEVIKRRFLVEKGQILNSDRIESSLKQINKQPDRTVRAVLSPGDSPETSDILLKVENERSPHHFSAELNNRGTRYTSLNRWGLGYRNTNLLGNDDILSLRFIANSKTEVYSGSAVYDMPVSRYNTRAGVYAAYSKADIGGQFAIPGLSPTGHAELWGLYVTHPWLNKEFTDEESGSSLTLTSNLTAGFDSLSVHNDIMEGLTSNDELRILKAGINFEEKDNLGRTGLVTEAHFGIPEFLGSMDKHDVDASRIDAGGEFQKYTGSISRVTRLPGQMYLINSFKGQYTPFALVSGAQMAIGGAVGTSANYLDTRVANIDDYSGGNVGTDLYISEYDGVILGALNTDTGLSTANGEIKVVAAVTAAGDLTAQKLTAGGTGKDIYLTTDNGGSGNNSIGLGVVTASGDDIYLNSDWNITDSDLDLTADLVSSGLYFTALGSFGGSGDPARIETTVDTIDDYALGVNVSGSIYISETDAVTLGSIFGLTTDAGVIDIVAGGTITTGTLAANGGFGIFLNSTGADLVDLANGSFTATAKSELRAGGIIGTIENPYDVNVTSGGLWVWAGSLDREVSANLRGTVVSSADTERVEIFEPSPPGLVIFDNHLMGGGNYGSGSTNGSILSRGYGYINVFRSDFIDSVYARALEQPWGYKLLLAWALAEGPKVDEKLMSDVPTVIDVSQLNLPVLYMDMNKPMDYYVIRSIR